MATSSRPSPLLTRIDALHRAEHHFLREEDECYFLREYTAGAGFQHGETNDLISNLKKPVDRRERPEWRYKERAIAQLAMELGAAAGEWLAGRTVVPLPPSRAKGDPLYDDRLLRILELVGLERKLDVRELIAQEQSTRAAHGSEERLTLEELREVYRIEEGVAEPEPRGVVLFDDLVTSGAHFRVASELLAARFPGVGVAGLFLARRVRPGTGKVVIG
jgi:hypothetical protein